MGSAYATETLAAVDTDGNESGCVSAEEIRLLSSLGFMAARSGCLVPAVRIFEALAVLRPGAAFPFIGLAIAYLAVGMAGEAVHVLRDRALKTCSDRAELKMWLSLAFLQAGNQSAALREYESSLRSMDSVELPAIARTLTKMLGGRPDMPTWPVPAPVADADVGAPTS